jgi:hypothetical protein
MDASSIPIDIEKILCEIYLEIEIYVRHKITARQYETVNAKYFHDFREGINSEG